MEKQLFPANFGKICILALFFVSPEAYIFKIIIEVRQVHVYFISKQAPHV